MQGQASQNIPSERQTVTPCTLSQGKKGQGLTGPLVDHRQVSGFGKGCAVGPGSDKQACPWADGPARSTAHSVTETVGVLCWGQGRPRRSYGSEQNQALFLAKISSSFDTTFGSLPGPQGGGISD